jgi:hypothetical protein
MLRLYLYARVRVFCALLHTGPRVQQAPGLPCALCSPRGQTKIQTSGSSCREIANACSAVIPGRAKREPGIHQAAEQVVKWIPGSRREARPGMTEDSQLRSACRPLNVSRFGSRTPARYHLRMKAAAASRSQSVSATMASTAIRWASMGFLVLSGATSQTAWGTPVNPALTVREP